MLSTRACDENHAGWTESSHNGLILVTTKSCATRIWLVDMTRALSGLEVWRAQTNAAGAACTQLADPMGGWNPTLHLQGRLLQVQGQQCSKLSRTGSPHIYQTRQSSVPCLATLLATTSRWPSSCSWDSVAWDKPVRPVFFLGITKK